MGYYTVFKGSVKGSGMIMDKFCEAADREETFSPYNIPLSDWFGDYLNDGETMKWYDYEKDCIELSSKYPSLLFQLDGEGEESGDIWRSYFRSGKVFTQKAEVTFPVVALDSVLPIDVRSTKKVKSERVNALRKAAQDAVDIAERAAEEARRALSELS